MPSHAAAHAAVWSACVPTCIPLVGVPHGALYQGNSQGNNSHGEGAGRARLAPLHLHQPLRQVPALRLGARRARLRRILVRAPRLRSPAYRPARRAETACCREHGTRAGQTWPWLHSRHRIRPRQRQLLEGTQGRQGGRERARLELGGGQRGGLPLALHGVAQLLRARARLAQLLPQLRRLARLRPQRVAASLLLQLGSADGVRQCMRCMGGETHR